MLKNIKKTGKILCQTVKIFYFSYRMPHIHVFGSNQPKYTTIIEQARAFHFLIMIFKMLTYSNQIW